MKVRRGFAAPTAWLLGAVCTVGAIPSDATDPSRALRAFSTAELKLLREAVKAGLGFYGGQFEGLGSAVAAGTVGLEAMIPASTEMANGALVGLRTSADGAARGVESFASAQASTSPFFPGSLLGDFGELDRFQAGLEGEVAKARLRLGKRMLTFTRRVAASTRFAVNATLADGVDVAPPAPNPGTSVPLPPRELKIFALVAGSDEESSGDGILSVGGEADSENGSVTVTILGPSGFTDAHVVAVNPATGRWQTTFPAVGVGLPEGNYRVQAVQGAGASINAGVGVPGAP
ncbi:MAG TPA: hypothetical protein VFI25_15330 [Planctomycetota bacterium]|jgi:hypothetical protein|nr:hypothetical protein [Planctomycetota bacterium]